MEVKWKASRPSRDEKRGEIAQALRLTAIAIKFSQCLRLKVRGDGA